MNVYPHGCVSGQVVHLANVCNVHVFWSVDSFSQWVYMYIHMIFNWIVSYYIITCSNLRTDNIFTTLWFNMTSQVFWINFVHETTDFETIPVPSCVRSFPQTMIGRWTIMDSHKEDSSEDGGAPKSFYGPAILTNGKRVYVHVHWTCIIYCTSTVWHNIIYCQNP